MGTTLVYEPNLYRNLWGRLTANKELLRAIESLEFSLKSLNNIEDPKNSIDIWNPFGRSTRMFYTQSNSYPYDDITNALVSLIKYSLYFAGVATIKEAGAIALAIYYRMVESGEPFIIQGELYLKELNTKTIEAIKEYGENL